ncbi:hypothetical protein ACX1C1_10035 [Paenibacillus sp. strain BS8-2]
MKQKQRWGLLLAITLLIGLLSACGGGNTNANNGGSASTTEASASPTAEASATTQPEATPSTRSVTTLAGTIDIPSDPKRIVLTYDDDIDHFMALGLKPVAAPVYDRADNVNGFLPYLADQLEGMATFPLSPDFEPILQASLTC